MAFKKDYLDFNKLLRELEQDGLSRVYLLWGEEEYLKEQFKDKILSLVFPDGIDEFNYKKLQVNGELVIEELENAIDAMPFMAERTLVEVQDAEINKMTENDTDRFVKLIKDIPDYCTVVFIHNALFAPDGRLKTTKAIKKEGKEIHFTSPDPNHLNRWIVERFQTHGKMIRAAEIEHLTFVSGNLMNRLQPEIEKVAAYAKGNEITKSDIDAVANHIPEADVFLITDSISKRQTDQAAKILSELLDDKNNEPIALLALIGNQMRRLYAAKLYLEQKTDQHFLEETLNSTSSFYLDKQKEAARGFKLDHLRNAVVLCCEADYKMKSSGGDNKEILKELVMRICAGANL